MSNAEATIRRAILTTMAEREVSSEEEAVSAIIESIFAEPVRKAVEEYLKELQNEN